MRYAADFVVTDRHTHTHTQDEYHNPFGACTLMRNVKKLHVHKGYGSLVKLVGRVEVGTWNLRLGWESHPLYETQIGTIHPQ